MLVLQEESNFRISDLTVGRPSNREFVYEPMGSGTKRGGVGGDIKVEITWYSGNGRDISFHQQSIKEGLQKNWSPINRQGEGGES